jgi:hypothetical protein
MALPGERTPSVERSLPGERTPSVEGTLSVERASLTERASLSTRSPSPDNGHRYRDPPVERGRQR